MLDKPEVSVEWAAEVLETVFEGDFKPTNQKLELLKKIDAYLLEGAGFSLREEPLTIEKLLPIVQNNLGLKYYHGEGCDPDKEKAFKWIERAAHQELAVAQYALGCLYARGEGCGQKDLEQAFEWFQRAAKQGDRKAQHNLGGMYYNGEGCDPDKKKAVMWFRESALQGTTESYKFLLEEQKQLLELNGNTPLAILKGEFNIQNLSDEERKNMDLLVQVNAAMEEIIENAFIGTLRRQNMFSNFG